MSGMSGKSGKKDVHQKCIRTHSEMIKLELVMSDVFTMERECQVKSISPLFPSVCCVLRHILYILFAFLFFCFMMGNILLKAMNLQNMKSEKCGRKCLIWEALHGVELRNVQE